MNRRTIGWTEEASAELLTMYRNGKRLKDIQKVLKDKHGKEIYEGDIVNYPGNCLCVIKFNTIYAIFEREWFGRALKFHRKEISEMTFAKNNYFTSEVVGDIHQNPELIKGDIMKLSPYQYFYYRGTTK